LGFPSIVSKSHYVVQIVAENIFASDKPCLEEIPVEWYFVSENVSHKISALN